MKRLTVVLLLLATVLIPAKPEPKSIRNIKRKAGLVAAEVINYKEEKIPTTHKLDKRAEGVLVTGVCTFQITDDPAPLFTKHGQLEWLIPNTKGFMVLKNGQYMDMYCTDSFAKPFTNQTFIRAQCVQGQYFLVNGLIYPLSNFSCLNWPTFTARRTGRSCNGGTDLLEVGFEVTQGFLQTMDICHDEINEVTRYVHHTLYPSSAAFQHSVLRPRFITGDFYAGKNVELLYTKNQQNETFSKILNMDASPFFNYSNNIFISRGHLAAKTDFILGALQRATFLYVNVAPQWLPFNSGNWERVEFGVRKYAFNNNLTLECYTGTWGISQLPDVHGQPKELFLSFDENNNGLITVPKLYFRIVIETVTRRGIVLIGVNNPHSSLEQIKREYMICEDIGAHIDWLPWDKENLYKGYSYACSVPDFLRTVKDLPLESLETRGVLGIKEVGCSFSVNKDLQDHSPLLIRAGTHDWLYPGTNGLVELAYGEAIDMYCSESFIKPFHNYTKITAHCLKSYDYFVDRITYNFDTFICELWPSPIVRRTGRSCNGGTDLLEIGFELDKQFLSTMDICHDVVNEVTRYVHHILHPASLLQQYPLVSTDFITGDFYRSKNVSSLYDRKQQNATFSRILKMDASSFFLDSDNIFLVSGQLADEFDFVLPSQQRSTFAFVNAAPQWQSFNSGNWQRIVEGVRIFIASRNLTVYCYTGTWGVATLPDVNDHQQELYMTFDENNNGLIPVPKLFYRLIIDRESHKGIVLVGVNNPLATWPQIQSEYIICDDVGLEIDWIKWSKDSLAEGYSYACSVPDFLQVVKDLPLEKLATLGVLGVDD